MHTLSCTFTPFVYMKWRSKHIYFWKCFRKSIAFKTLCFHLHVNGVNELSQLAITWPLDIFNPIRAHHGWQVVCCDLGYQVKPHELASRYPCTCFSAIPNSRFPSFYELCSQQSCSEKVLSCCPSTETLHHFFRQPVLQLQHFGVEYGK